MDALAKLRPDLSFAGIGGAFWALLAGLALRLLIERKRN